jgi:prepilin-type N-terminal cleavage/methylation domain-containing protein
MGHDVKLQRPHPDTTNVQPVGRLTFGRGRNQEGFGLIEVMIAISLILATSVMAVTSVSSAFRDSNIGSQRLQASQLLATELRTGGCGSSDGVTELGTTFTATVTPASCSAGATETGTATWTANGHSNQLSMTSVAPPTSGTASAYVVTT